METKLSDQASNLKHILELIIVRPVFDLSPLLSMTVQLSSPSCSSFPDLSKWIILSSFPLQPSASAALSNPIFCLFDLQPSGNVKHHYL